MKSGPESGDFGPLISNVKLYLWLFTRLAPYIYKEP